MKRKRNLLFLFTIVRSAQLPALVWAGAAIISGPIARREIGVLPWALLAYGLLAIVTDGMFHFRQRYALEIGETVVNGLRAELFAKTMRQPMSFFHRVKIGRIIGRVTSDIESVRTGIQDVLFVSLVQGGQMLFTAVVMAWCDWVLFLVVLAMAPILWVVNNHFRVKLSHHTRAAQESFSRVTATLAESVGGIRVTQGFVRQEPTPACSAACWTTTPTTTSRWPAPRRSCSRCSNSTASSSSPRCCSSAGGACCTG
ncbi:MAG: ABC transporter ATP-binding protein [Lacunisphaera sp.]